MIHHYAFSNFQSFVERTEVSLRLTEKASSRGWTTRAKSGQRLSLAVAALGPNAAGKTALLKPLGFLAWFIRHSFAGLKPDDRLPFEPHFASQDVPAEFEVEAEDGEGITWRYALRTTPTRVLHEALYKKKERFGYVFMRDWDDAANAYSIKQQDFGLASTEAQKVRQNASLISTAAQYGVETAAHVAGFHLHTNINALGRVSFNDSIMFRAAEYFSREKEHQSQMNNLLKSWDLGLEDVELRQVPLTAAPSGQEEKVWVPWGVHHSKSGSIHKLPFMRESRGTQAAFVLLSHLLPALAYGGVAVIDEFENDLHPLMLEPILALFDNPDTNPNGAQIIFSCHSVEVLNLLHKPQVYLVEKDECQSNAWRLDSMQGVRSDDNYAAKYMSGAYGAIPRI